MCARRQYTELMTMRRYKQVKGVFRGFRNTKGLTTPPPSPLKIPALRLPWYALHPLRFISAVLSAKELSLKQSVQPAPLQCIRPTRSSSTPALPGILAPDASETSDLTLYDKAMSGDGIAGRGPYGMMTKADD